jgi:uncharacterized PurR-regulated membrane protein YhhQ (DUF165 family)
VLIFAVIVYALAMTIANLSIAEFGPKVSPINAFFLIGLDLALRDWLQVKLKTRDMGLLILASGGITYLLNPSAEMIAIASAIAFTVAAVVDWAVFTKVTGSWLKRANTSNVAGAAVDSLLFPTIAFGSLMPHIVLMQFLAKVAGGYVWALLLNHVSKANLHQKPSNP